MGASPYLFEQSKKLKCDAMIMCIACGENMGGGFG